MDEFRCCRNCKYAKKHGFSMVYCRFYGIDISASYNRCGKFTSKVMEEADVQIIKGGVREDLRKERVS